MPVPATPLAVKFERALQFDGVTSCWHWSGSTNGTYPILRHCNRNYLAHRYSFAQFNGPLTPGLDVDHICRNKLCVNPAHLRQLTRQGNMLAIPVEIRTRNRRKPTCAKGHAYTPENTLTLRCGERVCRTCKRERRRSKR